MTWSVGVSGVLDAPLFGNRREVPLPHHLPAREGHQGLTPPTSQSLVPGVPLPSYVQKGWRLGDEKVYFSHHTNLAIAYVLFECRALSPEMKWHLIRLPAKLAGRRDGRDPLHFDRWPAKRERPVAACMSHLLGEFLSLALIHLIIFLYCVVGTPKKP